MAGKQLKGPVRWTLAARQDLVDARSWYQEQAPHVEPRFRAAVRASLQRIRENPRLYPRVHAQIRRAVLHQFPYSIYYDQRSAERGVLVIAFVHQARDPRVWRDRI